MTRQESVSRRIIILPGDLLGKKTLGVAKREIVNPHERSVLFILKII